MSYYTDHRTQPAPTHTVWMEQSDGTDKEIELPTTLQVCSVCGGEGKHVNPSIDCDGISAEQFHDDPDFAEDYFSGTYDVTCYRCHGRNVERVIDEEALNDDQREAYEVQQQAEYECRAEQAAEMRMGA